MPSIGGWEVGIIAVCSIVLCLTVPLVAFTVYMLRRNKSESSETDSTPAE